MRQFYEPYRHDRKVSPLVRQLPWTHNLLILMRSKRPEEREFYLRLAHRERWGKRELERQLNGALFERTVLTPPKVSTLLTQFHPIADCTVHNTEAVNQWIQKRAARLGQNSRRLNSFYKLARISESGAAPGVRLKAKG
jgi:hypothetical protein